MEPVCQDPLSRPASAQFGPYRWPGNAGPKMNNINTLFRITYFSLGSGSSSDGQLVGVPRTGVQADCLAKRMEE